MIKVRASQASNLQHILEASGVFQELDMIRASRTEWVFEHEAGHEADLREFESELQGMGFRLAINEMSLQA